VRNPIALGDEDYGVGFNVPVGVRTAVQWGAVAVTQPTSGLTDVDHLPDSFINDTPDRSVKLEEPAKA
jgi:1-phosphofructokinase